MSKLRVACEACSYTVSNVELYVSQISRRKGNAARINPKREIFKQVSFKRMRDDRNEKH
jgi:hypothetical protein